MKLPPEMLEAAIEVSLKGHYGVILRPLVDEFVLPASKEFHIASTSRGTMLPATETTPRAPTESIGSVMLSSPLSTVRLESAMICDT